MKRPLFLFPLFLLACGGGAAQTAPVAKTAMPASKPTAGASAKASKVRAIDGISEYTLPNGLRVLLVPDGTQSTVTVNVTYFVGSIHEGYGESGMAHLGCLRSQCASGDAVTACELVANAAAGGCVIMPV